ncbi:MAG: Txe/YoeB family addiction module toxin [Oscillospiraceae bacterium]|jgi:toxin YoeB|nr:Txe/YoeB family addiction module toxin [Oscillospiraceae bacterium]
MSRIIFTEKAWEDYLYWQSADRKMVKRVNLLLKDIARNGHEGLGKPEPLRHREGWSRRIDDVNRLVYQKKGENIEILQCKGHYDD